MSEPTPADLRAQVSAVGTALLPTVPTVAQKLADHIAIRVPELLRAGAGEALQSSCVVNTTALLMALASGDDRMSISASDEVLRVTRELAQVSFPLADLRRAYRVGIEFICEVWADACSGVGGDVVPVVKVGLRLFLRWLETITEELDAEYQREDLRIARERSLARIEDVRQLLNGTAPDVVLAGNRLGYRLDGHHIALVLRVTGRQPDAGVALEAARGEIMSAMGRTRSVPGLTVRVDMQTAWWWLPERAWAGPDRLVLSAPVDVGVGEPGQGVEGLRRSHRQAEDAVRVARLFDRRPPEVTHHLAIRTAALCSTDPRRCQEYVQSTLGRLLDDGAVMARQRTTLATFYANNSNYRATATALGIHHNTVRYRIGQAERTLGHGVAERRLDVELALHLMHLVHPVEHDGD